MIGVTVSTEEMQAKGWGTETGLLQNYVGTVADSWFATDEKGKFPDRVFLYWRMINIEPDEDVKVPDEHTERFSIGTGWQIADDGKRVVPEDGNEKKQPHENSAYGVLINRVLGEKAGAEYGEAFADAIPLLAQRPGPRAAETWNGLRFHFSHYSFQMDQEDGTKRTITWNIPDAFVGAGEEGNETFGQSDESTPKPESAGDPASNGNKVLVAKLKALAKKSDDHATFLNEALDLDGLTDDSELMDHVMDEGPTGFYASVTG